MITIRNKSKIPIATIDTNTFQEANLQNLNLQNAVFKQQRPKFWHRDIIFACLIISLTFYIHSRIGVVVTEGEQIFHTVASIFTIIVIANIAPKMAHSMLCTSLLIADILLPSDLMLNVDIRANILITFLWCTWIVSLLIGLIIVMKSSRNNFQLGVDLCKANLSNSNLKGVLLNYSNLKYSNCNLINLTEASIMYADFQNATITGADITGANLRYTNLSNSVFDNSNLTKCNLSFTKLENTSFQNTILKSASFKGARFKNVNFDGAVYDQHTEWPYAFQLEHSGAVRVDEG